MKLKIAITFKPIFFVKLITSLTTSGVTKFVNISLFD